MLFPFEVVFEMECDKKSYSITQFIERVLVWTNHYGTCSISPAKSYEIHQAFSLERNI